MLETISGAVLERIAGEVLDNARLMFGRRPCVRDLDRVVREAVIPGVTVVADDPAVPEPLPADLMECLPTLLDPMPDALQEPAALVRRRLPLRNQPIIGGREYRLHLGIESDPVVDGPTAEVLPGTTDNTRRGEFLDLRPSGRSITGQRLVVCAGAAL